MMDGCETEKEDKLDLKTVIVTHYATPTAGQREEWSQTWSISIQGNHTSRGEQVPPKIIKQ